MIEKKNKKAKKYVMYFTFMF